MLYTKSAEQVELIRQSSLLVSNTLALVSTYIKIGAKATDIDKIAEEFIRDNGGEPAFKGYRGFPATLCVSMNEQVVHGIPTDKAFVNGDVVSVDCGVYKDGYYGDSAYTFLLGEISPEVSDLCFHTKQSLYLGIEAAKAGNRVGDIGFAIQNYAEGIHKYGIVRELVGHGVGKSLHEPPEVPNYGKRGKGPLLADGLVIAIEPMINLGKKDVVQADDGWTIFTKDKKPSAHYEHTICVRNNKADILSDHKIIEEEIKNNSELFFI